MRGKGDEALLGQTQREGFVGRVGFLRFVCSDGVFRDAFQPVLADDDGPFFTGLQIFRQAQPAPGEDIVPNVHRHLIDPDLVRLTNEAAPGIHRQGWIWQAADDLIPEAVTFTCGVFFKIKFY